MPKSVAALAIALALFIACNKSPSSPSPGGSTPGPPAPGSAIVYTAVGASDAIGVGASSLCVPYADCPNGTGYVPDIVRQLRAGGWTVSLNNLGIPGAVIGPDFSSLASDNGDTALNFIVAEAPFVPKDSTLVTVFAGANDVRTVASALGRGAGGSNPATYIDAQVQAFSADYQTLLRTIRSRAANAWIVIANLPNFAGLPYTSGYTAEQKQYVQRISVGFSQAITRLASPSMPVIDLMCDARSYDRGTYSSDGFHPNDTGYAYIASKYLDAIKSANYPTPAGSCAQMTLVPPLP